MFILESPRFCPIQCKSDPFCTEIGRPWLSVSSPPPSVWLLLCNAFCLGGFFMSLKKSFFGFPLFNLLFVFSILIFSVLLISYCIVVGYIFMNCFRIWFICIFLKIFRVDPCKKNISIFLKLCVILQISKGQHSTDFYSFLVETENIDQYMSNRISRNLMRCFCHLFLMKS